VLRKRLQSQLPGKRGSDRPRFSLSFSRLAWGLAVIALLVLNLASFVQLRQIRNQQAALAGQFENAQAALAILSSPDVMMLPISGETVTGTLLLDRERNQAVLVARDLPKLSERQIYQIWLVRPDGERDSAGLFRPEIGQSYTTQSHPNFTAALQLSGDRCHSGAGKWKRRAHWRARIQGRFLMSA
jgi:hypothetical protein